MVEDRTITSTTDQGPSAHNQTSEDHSHDPNQDARQPSASDVIEAEGLDRDSDQDVPDMTSATIDD